MIQFDSPNTSAIRNDPTFGRVVDKWKRDNKMTEDEVDKDRDFWKAVLTLIWEDKTRLECQLLAYMGFTGEVGKALEKLTKS